MTSGIWSGWSKFRPVSCFGGEKEQCTILDGMQLLCRKLDATQ